MPKIDDEFEIGDLIRIWDEAYMQYLTKMPMMPVTKFQFHDRIGIYCGELDKEDAARTRDYDGVASEETYFWIYIEGEKKLIHDSFVMKLKV